MRYKQSVVMLSLLILATLVFGSPAVAQENTPTGGAQPLFETTNVSSDTDPLSKPEVIRGRYVTINQTALRTSPSDAPVTDLVLNLFDALSWNATQTRVISNLSGSYTWLGTLNGVPNSHVILVVREGMVTGKVAMPGAIYTINPVDVTSGLHTITQVNPQITDTETQLDFLVPPNQDEHPSGDGMDILTASDDGTVIDLLVLYTDDARANQGSTAAIESLIELGVAETNQAYEQSGATQRLYLVYMAEVAHTENDNATDLGLFEGVGDGQLDIIHTLRNTYHADFSKLIVDTSGCGIANIQITPGGSPNFEDEAFSVTDDSCISPNYTFGHELGHNMGLRHDWYVDNSTTPYSYAHGYVDRSEGWRTIMSYNNVCTDDSTSCTRLLYFSNPNNSYDGNPMGVAGTTPANCGFTYTPDPETCVADNTSVLNATAVNNSQFRISQITWTGASSTDWNDANNWEIVQGAANRSSGATSTTVNRVPLAIDDVVIPTGLGTYPTVSGTQNARNVTIQDGATLDMSGGTLNVYGHWDEEGTGVFNGTGGTVNFVGSMPQTITQNAGSNFNNITIGDGTGSIEVTLGSDLDVNGDLTIQAGASLDGGTQTINIAGNWDEQSGTAFTASTSTVIFDGATQTLDKTTAISVVDENFSDADAGGCGCSSAKLPAGWTRETPSGIGWLGGDISGSGEAIRWDSSADAWMFTTAVDLVAGINYEVAFDYRTLTGSTDNISIHVGDSASSGSMTQVTTSGDFSTTTYQTHNDSFTVATSGTYYIGIRSQQVSGAGYAMFDNFSISGTNGLTFYNLQVSSTGSATINQATAVNNNLTTNSGGTLNVNGQTLSVEGTVTNNGTLQDTLDAPNSTQTNFLLIQNAAANVTKYQGVEITPTGGAMGNTTVQVSGNQNCTTNPSSNAVERCFDIAPTSANAATIRFYYDSAEANGNAENAVGIYHWNGTSWDLEMGTVMRSSGADPRWVQVTGVSNYSPFVLDDITPTAVTLTQTDTTAPINALPWLLTLTLLSLTGFLILRRRTASA